MRTWLFVVAVLAGCGKKNGGKDLQAAVEAHRAEAQKMYAAFEAVAAKPAGPADGKLTAPPDKLTGENTIVLPAGADAVHKLVTDPNEFSSGMNTHLAEYAWIPSPSRVTRTLAALLGTAAIKDSKEREMAEDFLGKADKATIDGLKADQEKRFAQLAKIKYVLLAKTTSHKTALGGGGEVVADVWLYDLAGKSYGGVHIAAHNSSSVEVNVTKDRKTGQTLSSNDSSAWESDLDDNAAHALQDQIAAQLPGAEIPCAKYQTWCKQPLDD